METVTNVQNLQPLVDAAASLESGILRIASGWIRSPQLRQVISPVVSERIRRGDVELRLLLRIGSLKDVEITDPGVFALLDQLCAAPGARVSWRYSPHHHSKVYVAGNEWAMAGSFNLTHGGFGSEDDPGTNPEAGIVTTKKGEVRKLIETFDLQFSAARVLPEGLMGLVANGVRHDGFAAIAVRPLPSGTFVEVPTDINGVTILAVTTAAGRLHPDFYTIADDPSAVDPRAFRHFGNRNDAVNVINTIALSTETEPGQMSYAEVTPLYSVVRGAHEESFRLEPVNLPPPVGAPVLRAGMHLLSELFDPTRATYAAMEENREVAVSFDDAQILSKHMAVLGSTGSGKSYFTKRFLERALVRHADPKALEPLRVVIVDTHGEYSASELSPALELTDILADAGMTLRATATPATTPDDLLAEIDGLEKQDVPILKRAFAAAEAAVSAADREASFVSVIQEEIDARLAADHAAVDWNRVLEDLRDTNAVEDKKPTNDPIGAIGWQYAADVAALSNVTDRPTRERLQALVMARQIAALQSAVGAPRSETVQTKGLQGVVNALAEGRLRLETLDLVERLERPGVYRLDLQPVDDPEVRQAIVGDLMKEVFERAKARSGQGGFKTLFVVDEAQNYAPERSSRSIPSFRWMKVIASEGRKFGVALLVLTQRPAYLSKDILAQCNTQAIFRLINQGDIDQVANTVEGVSDEDLRQLPNFVVGQAIFTGVGVRMPVRVRVAE